jgi:hypothetical protein
MRGTASAALLSPDGLVSLIQWNMRIGELRASSSTRICRVTAYFELPVDLFYAVSILIHAGASDGSQIRFHVGSRVWITYG